MELRERVRLQAGAKCEYCCFPEEFATLRFQLDHVIAQKHRGPTLLKNLAWFCADCNAHKGTDLASIDPATGKRAYLFNPRNDKWDHHFRWRAAKIVGKTATGRATVELLQFNSQIRVAARQELLAANLLKIRNG